VQQALACLHRRCAQLWVCPVHTNTRGRCKAWQGMGECGARAMHERAAHWRKHIHGTGACSWEPPAPRPASSNWLGAQAVHTTGCRLKDERFQSGACAPRPGTDALHCFLSPFARTGNPTSLTKPQSVGHAMPRQAQPSTPLDI